MQVAEKGTRWEALDVLRGLSVIGMLISVFPGSWEHRFQWLDHAAWERWTLIDMVFPTFLFCVGASFALSFDRRLHAGAARHVLMKRLMRRSIALIAIGVLLNAYPSFDWAHVRLPGVLQRIGLCSLLVGMLILLSSTQRAHALEINNRLLGSIAIIILVLYWLLLAIVPSPGFGAPRFDSVGSWPAVIDRAVFGLNHLFIYATTDGKVTYDPEGLLSTFPACVNAIVGVITAHWMIRNDSRGRQTVAFIAGIALMAAGTLLGWFFPIIKKIWTSSFVLLSSGFSLVALAALDALLNRFELPRLMVAVRVFGTNALLAFALSFLLFPILDANAISRNGALISAHELLYSGLVNFIPDLYASFVYGAVITLLIFLMLVPLYRRRWFIRL